MKNFNFRKGVIAVLALAAIGCTKKEEGGSGINLDRALVTMDYSGGTPVTITVEAASNWTAAPSVSWITLSDQTANSIVVSVEPNDGVERDGEVVFTAGDAKTTLKVKQLENPELPAHFRKFDEYQSAVASPTGKYITAMGGSTDDAGLMVFNVYLIETATDARTHVGTYTYELSAPFCVTDDGSMMFYAQAWVNTALIEPDGSDLILSYPDLNIGTPRISCVSTDNRIWGGYFGGTTKDGNIPYIFVDGEPTTRLEVPETNFRGAPRVAGNSGFQLRGGSADGTMFYGTSWDNLDYGMCYWDKEGKFHWVGGDMYKTSQHETVDQYGNPKTVYCVDWGVQCEDEQYKMSPNGKYIGCMIYQETFDEAQGAAVGSRTGAAVFDTETGEVIMMPSGMNVFSVTDSGLAVVVDGAPATSSTIYDLKAGVSLGDGVDWVRENFGIDISNSGGCFVTHIFGENDNVVFGCYPTEAGTYNYWYAAKNN